MNPFRSQKLLWPVSSWRHKLVVLFAAGLAGSLLAFEALRVATAATLGESDQPQLIETALSLDPSNADLHHRLGLLRYYSASRSVLATGRGDLQRATELGPSEALYWSDLASACESSGDDACADRAMGRALNLSSLTPRIYWAAANYYLRSDRQQKAIALFRRLLELDTSYAEPTFRVCLRALGTPNQVADALVERAQDPQLELAFVKFMSGTGEDDSAYRAWRRFELDAAQAAARLPSSTLTSIAPYLDHLIECGRESEARAVWADLERMQLIGAPADEQQRRAAMPPSNLVFNSGFEQNPLNWGFDWRYRQLPSVTVGLSNGAAHGGTRCMRCEFTLPANEECEPIYQMVPMNPNQSYVLTAFVRSHSITSDTGPRLRVVDPFCLGRMNAETESTVGTTPWHQIQLSFSTGPETHFVRISLWRPRSRSFPSEIQGEFWLDDVSLLAAGPQQIPAGLLPRPKSPDRLTALR
jgi:tetratricopeptide (TPR) repeat protein